MTLPYIPAGVDRREVIWPNEKLVVTPETGDATSVPQTGSVNIAPRVTSVIVKSVTPHLTLTTSSSRVQLDASGTMRALLVCTDDLDIEPHNSWTYTFTGDWPGAPTITCPVPKVEIDPETGKMPPLNLSTLVSVASASGVMITKGDKGDRGPAGPTIASIDADGTVHLSDGSTVQWPLPGHLSEATLNATYAPASALVADDLINEWWVTPTAHYMAPPLDRTYWCGTSRSGEIVVGYTDHRLGKTYQEIVGVVAQPDDHSVPALMMADGEIPTANTGSRIPPKAAIVFWTEHNRTNTVHLRRAKKYWSIRDWYPEQTIDFGGPVSYTQVFRGEGGTGGVGADTLVLIARVEDRYWAVCRSLDYGATWTVPVKFLDYGAGNKGYFIGVQSNHTDGTGRDLIHFAMYGHPTESTKPDIRTGTMLMNSVLEVRTPNGSGGSTLLGNVTGLATPFTAEQFRASIPIVAGQNSRLFYISDRYGKPELAYAQWADGQHTTSQYKYAVAPTLYGNYTIRDVAQSGINFGESAVKHYIAGMCFPPKTPGQVVYYGYESGGAWYIEKAVTADDGVTWTKTVIASGPDPMIRPACPTGGGPYEVLWSRLAHYSQDEGGGADYLADLMGGSA